MKEKITFSTLPIYTPYLNSNGYPTMMVQENGMRGVLMNYNGSYYGLRRDTTYALHKELELLDMTPLEFFDGIPKDLINTKFHYKFAEMIDRHRKRYENFCGNHYLSLAQRKLLLII